MAAGLSLSLSIGAGAIAVLLGTAVLQSGSTSAPTKEAVERGRYLTHSVTMCVECHSPRDDRGAIITSREFEGAPNPFPAPFGQPWAMRSVNLRSLARLDPEAVMHLLKDGVGRRGVPPDPPMPHFRLTREDARAIVDYLRSLP